MDKFNPNSALADMILQRRRADATAALVPQETDCETVAIVGVVRDILRDTDRYLKNSINSDLAHTLQEARDIDPAMAEDLVHALRNSASNYFWANLQTRTMHHAPALRDVLGDSVTKAIEAALGAESVRWAPLEVKALDKETLAAQNAPPPSDFKRATAKVHPDGTLSYPNYSNAIQAICAPNRDETYQSSEAFLSLMTRPLATLQEKTLWMAGIVNPSLMGSADYRKAVVKDLKETLTSPRSPVVDLLFARWRQEEDAYQAKAEAPKTKTP